MLTYNTLNELANNPAALEIVDYYEAQGLIHSTDEISSLVDNVFINAEVVYTSEAKDEEELLQYINNNYANDKPFKTIDEAQNSLNIDIIDGVEVYAVIE